MLIAMTGATGFVGMHTASALLERGHSLRLLARDPQALAKELHGCETVQGSLNDAAALGRLVDGADAVLHVAGAIMGVSRAAFMTVNERGTRRVAEAAAGAGVKRFVHVSSLAAREPRLSDYAASKAAGEASLRDVADAAPNMDHVILRPAAVYGPGDKATLPLVKALSGNMAVFTGPHDQRLSLLHVSDLAQALVHAVEGAGKPGVVYELDDGTSGGYSHQQMVEAARETTGHTGRLYHLPRALLQLAGLACEVWMKLTGTAVILSRGKVRELYHPSWVVSGPGFEEESGWKPAFKFADGYGQTLKWYRDNGWLPAR